MIRNEVLSKTKVAHWAQLKQNIESGKRPMYMKKLARKQCRAIIQVRGWIIPVHENQGIQQENTLCRLCGKQAETQHHVIEICQEIKQEIAMNIAVTIKYEDIFRDDNIEALRDMGNYINIIEEKLKNRSKVAHSSL